VLPLRSTPGSAPSDPGACGLVGLACVFLLAPIGGGCSRTPPRQVVLVTVDTLRADHVGARRGGVPLTPALDRLAADAIRYQDALANCSITLPSHASILSGQYPWRHRVLSNDHALPQDVPWLPELLQGRGFATGAVVSSLPMRAAESGLARGFGSYDERFDSAERNRAGQLVKSPAETTRVALAWIEAHRRRDFFLWVHYFPPHGPYTPPAEFLAGLPSLPPRLLSVSRVNFEEGAIPAYQRLGEEADAEAYRRRYAGHVRYVDHHLGALLEGLRSRGLYRNALVVVTSDHGESLGEHGFYFCHGNLAYQEQVAIPLLVKLPGNREAGRVLADPVEGVDLAPTVLRVLGLQGAMPTEGREILPEALAGAAPRTRFTQSNDAEVVAAQQGATKLLLRLKPPKLAGASHPERAAFALDADPAESAPGAGSQATLAKLEAELRRRYQGLSVPPRELTPERQEALEALGYVK
jgi:arylsulfatase A-like enzyme